jgi:RNA polymerase sigma-70 factor (ECF subfamily)
VADFIDELEACVPSLRRYARALAGERDLADDLVQSCLERAWKRRQLWRRTGSLRSWLFTILHNVYANEMRSRSRRPRTVPLDALQHAGDPPAQDAHAAAREVLVALDTLPDEQRQVILLVGMEGFSYREAAAALDVPIGTVMSRLSRGRERLRALTDEPGAADLRRVK